MIGDAFCRVVYMGLNDTGSLFHMQDTDKWDRVHVKPLSSGSDYGEQVFMLCDHRDRAHVEYKVNGLLALLQQAYDLGRRAQLNKIQDALGIAHDARKPFLRTE